MFFINSDISKLLVILHLPLPVISNFLPKVLFFSNIEPSEFAIAVISNNTSKLIKIPGIGAKTAARIVLELKDKLISYFKILSEKNFSKTFTLPFSLTDLADYLSIDRSAMMRELKSLKEEGFIKKSDKNKITLLS